MIRILHILDGFGMGGAETWLVSIVKFCHDTSYPIQNDFVCTGGEERIFDQELLRLGSKMYYIKYSSRSLFKFRAFMEPILKNGKYTAIWNHGDYISGWQFLAMWGYLPGIRIAYLHNPINQTWQYRKTPARKFIYHSGRLLMALIASHLTGTSDQVMNEYGYDKWPYSRIRIKPIHCAFDLHKFTFSASERIKTRAALGIPENNTLIVFIGRLRLEVDNPFPNQKNPLFALQLAQEVSMKSDDFIFMFVGDKGHTGEEMELSVEKRGLQSKIIFIGVYKEIQKILFAADALLFPSTYEGLGMVAVEAQATGLPVFMSDRVPLEAHIDASLLENLPLVEKIWVESILQFKPIPRFETINKKIENSDFNILNCIEKIDSLLAT